MAISKVIAKIASSRIAQGTAVAGALYLAHRGKKKLNEIDDREHAKEIRKESRSFAKNAVKKGQGRWITVKGRKLFISNNKKISAKMINEGMKATKHNLYKLPT